MNQIKTQNSSYIYKSHTLGKYIFTGIFLFIFLFSQFSYSDDVAVTDTSSKEECKTCSGPSDEMILYRGFIQWTIDSVSLKKPAPIVVADNVKWLSKNADSALKSIAYTTRANTKTSFRKTLYNGKDTVYGIQNFAKNLISFGNITKLRELQSLDRYADIIDQLSLKLIETKQFNSQISDADMAKIKAIFDKYSDWWADDKIFSSKMSENLKWKTYSDLMKFLLSVNNKVQWFVLNGTLKTINTSENSTSSDLVANRDKDYIKKITKSYACSRWLNKCEKIKYEFKKISDSFKTNMKSQKSEIQTAVNDLKKAMGKFNNVVLWTKDADYGSDLSDTNTDKKWWFLDHFQVNKNGDAFGKINDMWSDAKNSTNVLIDAVKDSYNKIKNARTAQKTKKLLVDQTKKELEDSQNLENDVNYEITINNKQNDYNSNKLASAKSNINNYVTKSIQREYDTMDKNILAESESMTLLFPKLSEKVYYNISALWNRTQNDSTISNFVAMCEYQCQNLWWKCEPAIN